MQPFTQEITGAIFDMDGTILDSAEAWRDVEYKVLKLLGYTPKPTLRQDVFPLGALDMAPFLKRDYGMTESVEEIDAYINAQVARYYFHEAVLKPGALEFLRVLKTNGVKLALATGTGRIQACSALNLTGAMPLFDVILTCQEVGYPKSNPEIFRLAASEMGTDKSTTWVFEDALYAIETARDDGFVTCGVADSAAAFQQVQIQAIADYYLPAFSFWRETLPFSHRFQ